jgi:hypothetical protein
LARLVHGNDIPFGLMEVSLAAMGFVRNVLCDNRAVKSAFLLTVVPVSLACGIAEIACGRVTKGIILLAFAPPTLLIWNYRRVGQSRA